MKIILFALLALVLAGCEQDKSNKAASNEQPAGGQQVFAAEVEEVVEVDAATPVSPRALGDENEQASYAIGFKYGESLGRDLPELNLDSFWIGIKGGFIGDKPLMSDEDIMKVLQALQARKMKEMQEKAEVDASENQKQGADILAKNKTKDGVVTTPTGLQYEVIKPGEGAVPGPGDEVTVHYTGTLLDGTVFDSSVERGEPASFGVEQVIPGWTEALQMMKKGAEWKVVIPSELAYGERGAGANIGPNAVLIFTIQLLDITKAEAPVAGEPAPAPATVGETTAGN